MFTSRALLADLLTIAAVLATTACHEAKHYTEQEYMQRGKEFQAQGKYESAVIELKNALQQNPKNAEGRRRLGEVYAGMGLGQRAEAELNRAKELGVDYELLKIPIGQALLQQGLYQRVASEVEPGPKSSPGDIPKIMEIQGRAQIGLRHFEQGCKLFAESFDADPNYIPSQWGLAHCMAARGKLDDARTQLNAALKLDEKNTGTWTQIGDFESAARQLPAAEKAYDAALRYKADNLDALLGRAFVKIDSDRWNDAIPDVDLAFKLAKDHPIVSHLRGIIQFKQGHFPDARTSFQTSLRANPDYIPAVLWLGLTNFAEADYEQASRQFAIYTRQVPGPQANALLALAQARLGRKTDAERTLQALANVNVKDPQSLALVAQAHMSVGANDLAATYLAKAVERKPDAADLRVALAESLSRKGDNSQAIEQLENAVRLDPGMVNADVLLIRRLIQDKQFDKALAQVEVVEKQQPNNAEIMNLKGAIYLSKQDVVNARKSFEQASASATPSMAAAMNLAQLDLEDKNPEAARRRFQSILAKDGKNVQAMIGLAAIAATASQESEYVAWLDRAVKTGPSAVHPRVLLGTYYLRKNDVQMALALAGEANTAEPNSFETLDLLGTAQRAAGENENAVKTYGKLANLFPKNATAHFKLAAAQVATDNITTARVSLQRALALQPRYLDAEILLASIELGTNHPNEAAGIAQKIQEQYPTSAAGFAIQGDVYLAQKQYAPALKSYEKALSIDDNGFAAIKVHRALKAAGNSKEADARLIRWLAEHPGDSNVRVYLAASYMAATQNKLAIEQYQQVLKADAKNVRALNDLAWLYQREKDPRALATAEQAYLLKPNNPEILDTLGWILVGEDKTARGTELLQKAAQAEPTSTLIRYHWAVALAKSGDKTQARRELADLLAKNKVFPERLDVQALLKQL